MTDAASSFGLNAAAYDQYRPTYPAEVYKVIEKRLAPPRTVCVELGAGSGKATRELIHYFKTVHAVEPDARMLEQQLADERIFLVNIGAEDADFAPDSVDAVVCATSFHWMDQQKVLANAHAWLRPGGAFYAFLYGPMTVTGAASDVQKKIRTRLGSYRDKALGAKSDYSIAIRGCDLFDDIAMHKFQLTLHYTPEQAAALILTTSFATAYVRANDCEAEYRAELEADFAAAADIIDIHVPMGGVSAIKAG